MNKNAGIQTPASVFRQAEDRLEDVVAEANRVVSLRDADAIHDLRVAVRRFSQALRIFRPFFRGGKPDKIRRKVKRVMAIAGDARNCDIALKLLSKSGLSGGKEITDKLRFRRRKAERALVEKLARWQERETARKWRAKLEEAVTTMQRPAGMKQAADDERRLLPAMARDFFELGNRAARAKSAPEELHRFRIAAKKFRYTLELFKPEYGPALDPLIEKIKHCQSLLGSINDCETGRKMISEFKGAKDFEAWLEKRERRKITGFRKYWRETCSAKAETRRWRNMLRHPDEKPEK